MWSGQCHAHCGDQDAPATVLTAIVKRTSVTCDLLSNSGAFAKSLLFFWHFAKVDVLSVVKVSFGILCMG